MAPIVPRPRPPVRSPGVPARWDVEIAALRCALRAQALVLPIPESTFAEPLRWGRRTRGCRRRCSAATSWDLAGTARRRPTTRGCRPLACISTGYGRGQRVAMPLLPPLRPHPAWPGPPPTGASAGAARGVAPGRRIRRGHHGKLRARPVPDQAARRSSGQCGRCSRLAPVRQAGARSVTWPLLA